MDEVKLEHRLSDVENRSKSNTHRLDEVEKKQAIEDYHMKLVEDLSSEDRKLVLHIIDLKDQIAEDLSIDSFMSGFQLAWKLATELNIREKQRPSLPSIPSVRMDAFYISKFMKEGHHEQKEHNHKSSRHRKGS